MTGKEALEKSKRTEEILIHMAATIKVVALGVSTAAANNILGAYKRLAGLDPEFESALEYFLGDRMADLGNTGRKVTPKHPEENTIEELIQKGEAIWADYIKQKEKTNNASDKEETQ